MSNTFASEFLENFWKTVRDKIDEEGFGQIGAGVIVHRDGKITYLALAMDNPLQAYAAMIAGAMEHATPYMSDKGPSMIMPEMVFGWDRYTLPGQGNKHPETVSIHYCLNNVWKFGVVDYQSPKDGKPKIVEPYDWLNVSWVKMMEMESASCFRQIIQAQRTGDLSKIFVSVAHVEGAGE